MVFIITVGGCEERSIVFASNNIEKTVDFLANVLMENEEGYATLEEWENERNELLFYQNSYDKIKECDTFENAVKYIKNQIIRRDEVLYQ